MAAEDFVTASTAQAKINFVEPAGFGVRMLVRWFNQPRS
jgi:hypothetical protein